MKIIVRMIETCIMSYNSNKKSHQKAGVKFNLIRNCNNGTKKETFI